MSESKRKRSNKKLSISCSSNSTLSHCDVNETSKDKKGQIKNSKDKYVFDKIKKIVLEEGRSARNLVTWSVSLGPEKNKSFNQPSTKFSPGSNMKNTPNRFSPTVKSVQKTDSPKLINQTKSTKQPPQSPSLKNQTKPLAKDSPMVKYTSSNANSQHPQKISSTVNNSPKSVQSTCHTPNRRDIRARYWAYLFDNLRRAVDEIYTTCEADESIIECKEVMMMLDQYKKDFSSLIECMGVMKNYEQADESSRRKNLAWEVRKRSPSKPLSRSYMSDIIHPSSSRILDFSNHTLPNKIVANNAVKNDNGILNEKVSEMKDDVKPLEGIKGADDIEKDDRIVTSLHGNGTFVSNDLSEKVNNSLKNLSDEKDNADNNLDNINKSNASIKSDAASNNSGTSANKTWADKVRSLSKSVSDCVSSTSSLASIPFSTKSTNANSKLNSSNLNVLNSKVQSTETMSNGKTMKIKDKNKDSNRMSTKGARHSSSNTSHSNNNNTKYVTTSYSSGKINNERKKRNNIINNNNFTNQKKSLLKTKNSIKGNTENTTNKKSDIKNVKDIDGWETVLHKGGKQFKKRISLDNKNNLNNVGLNFSDIKQNALYKSYSFDDKSVNDKIFNVENDVGKCDNNCGISNENIKVKNSNLKSVSSSSILTRQETVISPLFIVTKFHNDSNNEDKHSQNEDNSFINDKDENNVNDRSLLVTTDYMETLKKDKRCEEDYEEDNDDELNEALITVLSEEDDLENLYERERQAAYESALQQEENYLQAIAREESKANDEDDYDVCYNESCDGHCCSLCYNDRGDYYRENSCGKRNYSSYLNANYGDEENCENNEINTVQKKKFEESNKSENNNVKKTDFTKNNENLNGKGIIQNVNKESMQEAALEHKDDEPITDDTNAPWNWEFLMKKYQEEMQERQGKSWGDIMEEVDMRTPGRVVTVHEKLSSASRKRPTIESKEHLDEKQARAAELREKTLQERGENLRMLRKKVEEIQLLKNELLKEARENMEKKLKRAEEKRQIVLRMKVEKARDEDMKASEIAFINALGNENKRHFLMTKYQESEARLHDIQEERHRRYEEKAAKEAAAEERRKVMEAERMGRLQEMQERRKQRETEFEIRQQEKEKERVEAARLRGKEREERLAALNKQQQTHIEELQKKIQQKQDETDRRHKEKLEAIQEKAFRMSVQSHSGADEQNDLPPLSAPYERKKLCTACNVFIPSEVYLLSHLRGKTHMKSVSESGNSVSGASGSLSKQDIEKFNLQHIQDAPLTEKSTENKEEVVKGNKKRMRKLRMRMATRASDFETSNSNKSSSFSAQQKQKFSKVLKELQKVLGGGVVWSQSRTSNLDRCLGELVRILEKQLSEDKTAFKRLNGLNLIFQLLESVSSSQTPASSSSSSFFLIPLKSIALVQSVLWQATKKSPDVCKYLLITNRLPLVLNIVATLYEVLLTANTSANNTDLTTKTSYNNISKVLSSFLDIISHILLTLSEETNMKAVSVDASGDGVTCVEALQAFDVVSYSISIGLVEHINKFFISVTHSIDEHPHMATILASSLSLLSALVRLLTPKSSSPTTPLPKRKTLDDPTGLIASLQNTHMAGIVSLLYTIFFYSHSLSRACPPAPLPDHTLHVALLAYRLLTAAATFNLTLFQNILGEEGTSLEFRHISSFLLWHCKHHRHDELLHEVILCIGHFTLLNPDNQLIIQSGQPPTILQQLCSLPFEYFSSLRLITILFPSLICCCFHMPSNKLILQQELSCLMLSNFLEENFLKDQQNSFQHAKNSSSTSNYTFTSIDKIKKISDASTDQRMMLAYRFPKNLWKEAQMYFNTA